jgi:hypothetical protein
VTPPAGPSPHRVLVELFLRQFVSFEATATGGEAKHAIIAVVSLLAAPGYLAAIVAARGSRATFLAKSGRVPPSLWLWREEWLLFAISLVVVATIVAVNWRALTLGERDRRILGLLPVPRRTLVEAKLASLGFVVLLLHLAINTLPGLWLPVASPLGYLRTAVALQIALLAQTAFTSAAIVGAQGLAAMVLPAGVARRAAAGLQAMVLLSAAVLFLAEGAVSRLAYAVRDETHLVNAIVPVVWFRALYLWIAGVDDPTLSAQAHLAVGATVLAAAIALPCSLLAFREVERPRAGRARGARHSWGRRLSEWLAPRSPVARGTCAFVEAALRRSGSAGLIARGWFFVGVALAVNGIAGTYLREQGRSAPVIPTFPWLAPAFVLPFFALVGLRLAATYPSSPEANWLFRLTEAPGAPDYALGVRRAALRVVVLPLLGTLAVLYVAFWGPARAAALVGLGLAVALVTVEWLFLGFPKVPFACTYLPGAANLRVTWPKHAAVFFVYCGVLPALAARLLASPPAYVVAVSLLLGVRWALARAADRSRPPRLVFDQEAHRFVTGLGLG